MKAIKTKFIPARKLIAFHGDVKVKAKYEARIHAHKLADQIIHGTYWEDGKGCAVGCTIHSDNHAEYETLLGIPRILARLEDGIFEALPNERALEWPGQFLKAIPVGADLSGVWPKFAQWLLTDPENGVIKFSKTQNTKDAIQAVSDLYRDGCADPETWVKARIAAYVAADVAYAADAAAAVYATATAHASAAAAAYAAYSAAASGDAAYDDYAAYSAAAAHAAYSAAAAASVDESAKRSARIRQADKLLELMSAAPVISH
jgi:hypothetical protein